MKNNPVGTFLAGLVALSVLTTAILSYTYVNSMRKLQNLQIQAQMINQNRSVMHSLASEAVEYSKRNPAMERILQDVGIKVRPGANSGAGDASTK